MGLEELFQRTSTTELCSSMNKLEATWLANLWGIQIGRLLHGLAFQVSSFVAQTKGNHDKNRIYNLWLNQFAWRFLSGKFFAALRGKGLTTPSEFVHQFASGNFEARDSSFNQESRYALRTLVENFKLWFSGSTTSHTKLVSFFWLVTTLVKSKEEHREQKTNFWFDRRLARQLDDLMCGSSARVKCWRLGDYPHYCCSALSPIKTTTPISSASTPSLGSQHRLFVKHRVKRGCFRTHHQSRVIAYGSSGLSRMRNSKLFGTLLLEFWHLHSVITLLRFSRISRLWRNTNQRNCRNALTVIEVQ